MDGWSIRGVGPDMSRLWIPRKAINLGMENQRRLEKPWGGRHPTTMFGPAVHIYVSYHPPPSRARAAEHNPCAGDHSSDATFVYTVNWVNHAYARMRPYDAIHKSSHQTLVL